jgi:diguanylate cyclase (GGDEF)-like protein
MAFDRGQMQARFNAWMLRVGKLRVVAAITAFSVVVSVLVTWFANAVFMPHVPVEEWLYISAIAPLLISPPISASVLSLLYQLAEARAALVTMAETDPLTGAGNRRYFFDRARLALAEAGARGEPVSIILLDIDRFKRLNDSYGHAVGDEAIIMVAHVCRRIIRAGDVFCRWGGEEFIVLLPAAELEAACALAERLRAGVAAAEVKGVPEGVTISLGVAELRSRNETLDDIIANADRQLYVAKDLGRNRVEPMDPAWVIEGPGRAG